MLNTTNQKRIKYQKMPIIKEERRVGRMLSIEELEKYRNCDFGSCDKNILTDINEIKIDTQKPVVERMQNYFASVSNPYVFRVGDIGVKVNCLGEKDLCDALAEIVNLQ